MLEFRTGLATKELLVEYGSISIAFCVEREYKVVPLEQGLKGFQLLEVKPSNPYWVDHGAADSPEAWWDTWDISNWGVVLAFLAGKLIGGGIVAHDTVGIDVLQGRKDIAALWDLRVSEEYRRQGVGSGILQACMNWAKVQGYPQLKIETQTYNVAACQFYANHGAVLGGIDCYAYPQLPRIKQLMWYLDLT